MPESDSSVDDEDEYAWIPWFCSLEGNEFFVEIDEQYIQDNFNLTNLTSKVVYYDYALDMILDIDSTEELMSDDQQEMVENDAETLYGLIHARFIITGRGLQAMYQKYKACDFGVCPRVMCRGHPLLPVGLSDQLNENTVKLYCAKCDRVYNSKQSRHEHIDGAFFGTTFAHLFFLTYPELKTEATNAKYTPKVFGYKVHKEAHQRALEARRRAALAKGEMKLRR